MNARASLLGAQRALARADRRLLARAVLRRTPVLDRVMTTASGLANRSMLWCALAGALAATGRRRARAAAAGGLLGIGFASSVVNGPLKFVWRRDRPISDSPPLLPLPRTFSFPSGHSASAFGFATGAAVAWPAVGPVVVPMAATVAYSRVHTGVHYPSDVAVGAALGVGSGLLAARVVRRRTVAAQRRVDAPRLEVPVPRRAVVVAGKVAYGLDAAVSELVAAGFTVEQTLGVDDVDRLAGLVRRPEGALLAVAAGGDGTVSAVANAIVGSDALLGIVPLGTSNDVARSLGIPLDPVEAVEVIAGGRVRAVDAPLVRAADGTERVFMNAATAGVNVVFARAATRRSLRARFGRLTYPVAAARALRGAEPFACTLEYADRRDALRVVHLSVSNAPVFGGVLNMRVPGASMADGRIEVIAVEPLSPLRLLLAVADAVAGRHRPVHGVHAFRVRSLAVAGTAGQEVSVDGEVVGTLPARFEVRAAGLRVLTP